MVSNAGIFSSVPFDELTTEQWRAMRSVHLDGGFHLSQAAFRVMKQQGYGRIVLISSSAGLFGQHLEAHYAAAKTGLIGLTNVLALEGAEHGILANAVLPFGFSRMVSETVGDSVALEASGFTAAIAPELVVPIVTYLASAACTVTHHYYSACAGRFARVFIGLGAGWATDSTDPARPPTAEDIAANLEQISATADFTVPMSIYDEVFAVCEQRGIGAGG